MATMGAKEAGAYLARQRKAAGLTQEQAAERAKVADKSVRNWESGVWAPRAKTLRAYAAVIGASIEEWHRLMGGDASNVGDEAGATSEAETELILSQFTADELEQLAKAAQSGSSIFSAIREMLRALRGS